MTQKQSYNFKLLIEYDGTQFYGWQRQKDKPTVQGELEKILSIILNQKITISGSGRTDAGVHAFGQVANFHAKTALGPDRIRKGVNSLIHRPIVIKKCEIADKKFHAQYDAVSKEYHYFILNREYGCAIGKQYQWHIKNSLDMQAMQACCTAATGVFDFSSFENTGSPRSSNIREVFFFTVDRLDNASRLVFRICASGFLKNMVRNLVGTIVLAGQNKITPEDFVQILNAKDRTQAGPTAPAHGLFLKRVNYS
jgi:tRNA pseudouridine38-40 synthase